MTRQPIIAIDPGTTQSGVVFYDSNRIRHCQIVLNTRLLDVLSCWEGSGYDAAELWLVNDPEATFAECDFKNVVIEMVASYGMAVGAEVFETCVWIGRFIEAWESNGIGYESHRMFRRDVKLTLCGSMRAKDANIRQALIDRFEPSGGGKTPQIGTKKQPGPLYGMKSHMWAALAVAVTWFELNKGDVSPYIEANKGEWHDE